MEHLPVILTAIDAHYKQLLLHNGFPLFLLLIVTGVLSYIWYCRLLYRRSSHQNVAILLLYFPQIESNEEEKIKISMQNVLANLHDSLSGTDILSLEIYKTNGYLQLQVVSNKKSILDDVRSAFGYIPGVKVKVSSQDALQSVSPLFVSTVAMSKEYERLSFSTSFFPGIVHCLSSLHDNEQAGIQIVFRGVNKRLPLYEKIQKILQRAEYKKRNLTPHEEELVALYQEKQRSPLFKVQLSLLANNRVILSRLFAITKPLSEGINGISRKKGTAPSLSQRFLAPDTVLTTIALFRQREGSYFTAKELSHLFHPTSVLRGLYAPNQLKMLEAPASFFQSTNGIKIGKGEDSDGKKRNIYFPIINLARHIYLIGKTGRGKSTLLTTLVTSLSVQKEATLFVFDPHGDLVTDIARAHHEKEMILLTTLPDKKTFTYNPLFSFQSTDNEKAALRDCILDIILSETQDGGGVVPTGSATANRIKHLVAIGIAFPDAYYSYLQIKQHKTPKEAYEMVHERQLSINDLPLLYVREREYISLLEEVFQYDETPLGMYVRKEFESHARQQMVVDAVQSRLEQLLHPSLQLIFEGTKVQIRNIATSGKLFLFPIPESMYGSKGAKIILQLFFSELWLYKRQQVDVRKETYLFIDEFQKAQIYAIPEIIAEGRKFKLFMILSHQQLGQLKESIKHAVLGNMGTIISFTVGADEIGAKSLSPVFGSTVTEKDLVTLPPYQAYMKTEGDSQKPITTFTFETTEQEKNDPRINLQETIEKSLEIYGENIDDIKKRLHEKQQNPLKYFLSN